MSEITKITCDHCSIDITYTTNCIGYRICVNNERQDNRPGFVTLLHHEPPLDGNKHFCGLACLKLWVMRLGEPHPTNYNP